MPKVSVIASGFKAQRFLNDFLQSMVEQIFTDFELVLHLNEPSKNETKTVERFSTQFNLSTLIENPVIPLYSAWNKCILASDSEYIAIGNVDDLRTKNSLKIMVEALEGDPQAGFVYGNFTSVSSFPSHSGHLIDIVSQHSELRTGMILGPFFMFRRSVLEKTGFFDEQFKSGGDYDFAMRLARVSKGICLSDNLGFYLDEGKGLSTGSILQPLERTVVEMRYGLNVLEKKYFKKAQEYKLEKMLWQDKWHPILGFFKNNSIQAIDYQSQAKRLATETTPWGSIKSKLNDWYHSLTK